jgi:hypothetical protein
MYQSSSWKMPTAFVWNNIKSTNLSISVNLIIYVCLVSTCCSWFSSHRSWDVNWFSKQSTVALAYPFRWYVIPRGPWRVAGAFGPFLFYKRFCSRSQSLRCDLTVAYFCFAPLECHLTGHSSDDFGDQIKCRFICWIPGYLPQLLKLCLCSSRLSRPGSLLFRSKNVILLVESLYAEVIEAVKMRATLSALPPR